MFLERRNKYAGSRTPVTNSRIDKVDINFDLSTLNIMCSYVISENRNIKRTQLVNLRSLFDVIDISIYQSDQERLNRITFIKRGLEARLIKNLSNPVLIIKYINGGIMEEDNILDTRQFTLLSNEEMNYVNETVSMALKYSFIYNDIDRMLDVCTRFKATDYASRGAIVEEIEALIAEMQAKFRRVKVESATDMTFTLMEGRFEETIREIHEKVTNPSRRLKTGMQGFNEMLGGGFESERVYMLFGNTGIGKSLTLLNLALQIKKYNKTYQTKDPTKRPVIVYLTMENNVTETVQRLFEIAVGKGDMAEYKDPEVIIDLLRKEGELFLTDESPIDIIIRYMPDRSVDTSYLYTMTEDLEDEGYEVICIIQDHIKRIRSTSAHSDVRLELGAVVNEIKTFATIKDMPVISNSHLNRDGARTVDEGARQSKSDLIRQLGRANIGESMLMLDNLDGGFLIGPEYDPDGNKYMTFLRIKNRYKATLRDYICQPFVAGSEIKLTEDMDLPVPLFKETMKATNAAVEYTNNINNRQSYNDIKELDDSKSKLEDFTEDFNIFNGKIYFEEVVLPDNEEEELIQPLIAPFTMAM